MAQHNDNWLLDPVFPAPSALPRLDAESDELESLEPQPSSTTQYPSGTWRLGVRVDEDSHAAEDVHDERARRSSSDAPTVRPGSLHALKTA